MKKAILILIAGLLLSGNAYAGWFSKLPTLKCTVTSPGEPAIVQFLILKNYWTDRGAGSEFQKKKAHEKSYTYVDVKKDTFVVHDWIKEFRGGQEHSGRLIKWYISRKTGELYLTVSPTMFYGSGQTAAVLFEVERTANGLCVEAK